MGLKTSDLSIHMPPQRRTWGFPHPQEVGVTHKPTGITFRSSAGRSVDKNKRECLRILEARLSKHQQPTAD